MFVEDYYNVHPDFELVIQRLNKEIIGSRYIALELSLIDDTHFLGFRSSTVSGSLLEVLDTIAKFLQEDLEWILNR